MSAPDKARHNERHDDRRNPQDGPAPTGADFDEAEADVEAHGLEDIEDEQGPVLDPNAVCI